MASPSEVQSTTRAVLAEFCSYDEMFTALDVSNEVKNRITGVRHREVSPVVREVFEDGELDGDWPIDRDTPSVIVDMAGDQPLLATLHGGLGDLRHSARVGMTHWDSMDAVELPAPAPEFFFAPSQIQVRAAEWGAEELNSRLLDAVNRCIDD